VRDLLAEKKKKKKKKKTRSKQKRRRRRRKYLAKDRTNVTEMSNIDNKKRLAQFDQKTNLTLLRQTFSILLHQEKIFPSVMTKNTSLIVFFFSCFTDRFSPSMKISHS